MPDPFKVFISYAHADDREDYKAYVERLLARLHPLEAQQEIQVWVDRDLQVGDEWEKPIQSNVEQAQAAILLISPEFLASTYIRNKELPVLLENAKKRGILILPVVLRSCSVGGVSFKFPDPINGPEEGHLDKFQTPNWGEPLDGASPKEQDRIFEIVAQRIKDAVEEERKLRYLPKWLRRLEKRGWVDYRNLLLGLSMVVLSFLFQTLPAMVEQLAPCRVGQHPRIMQLGRFYQALTEINPKTSANRFTAIVTESFGNEGEIGNACTGRLLDAKLIRALLPHPPAAILIDAGYSEANCAVEDAGSVALKEALQEADAKGVPVIVGLWDSTREELLKDGDSELPGQYPEEADFIDEDQWRPVPESKVLKYALLRLNCDVSVIPLGWSALEVDQAKPKVSRFDTSSMAAARLLDPSLSAKSEVAAAYRGHDDLRAPLISYSHISAVTATEVICGGPNGRDAWKTCQSGAGSGSTIAALAGKVAIVSEIRDADWHPSPAGDMPGAALHASYVEALLGGSYYRSPYWLIGLAVSCLWFLGLEIGWQTFKKGPGWSLLITVVICAVFMAAAFLVFGRLYERWFVLWPPGLVAIVGKCFKAFAKERKDSIHPIAA